MPKWYPGNPEAQQFGLSWSGQLHKLGIPFEARGNGQLHVTRLEDARALDAISRLHPYGYGGGMGPTAQETERKNEALKRAAFERARRDPEFLEAIEAVTTANLFGGLDHTAVRNFLNEHVPADRPLAWRHDVGWEEAADMLANAARAFLDAPGTITADSLRRSLNRYDACSKALWRRYGGSDGEETDD